MRHLKAGSKLNRTSSHQDAMFRNMVTSLLKHDRIQTTETKAKVLRGWVDHVITLAKRGDLHARRQAMAIVREKDVVHKLFAEAASRFGAIAGGYTRLVKVARRPGDAAAMVLVELTAAVKAAAKGKKGKAKKAEPTRAPQEAAGAEQPSTAATE
jgi:large subunit ribosomal protein L17